MSKPMSPRYRFFGWVPTRAELRVMMFDFGQILAGRCNNCPWSPDPRTNDYRGGYSHWRCGLPRGHETLHRFRNYTWGDEIDQKVIYDPVPVRMDVPMTTHPDAPGFQHSFAQRRAGLRYALASAESGEAGR